MFHWIYFIYLFILMYFVTQQIRFESKTNFKNIFIVFAIILVLFAGFRIETGADYIPYIRIFRYASTQPFFTENIFAGLVEPTFIWISQLNAMLGTNFIGVTVTFAALAITLKASTIYKFSPYPLLALLLYYITYYFFQEYGHIRQGVAIAICFFSFRYITDRKLLKFALCIFIAYLFHRSALFFSFAYFIAPLKINTRWALVIILISIALIPLEIYRFFDFFTSLTETDSLDKTFNTYVDDKVYGQDVGFSLKGDLFKFLQLFFIFIYDKIGISKSKIYWQVRNLTLFGFAFFFLFRGNEIFATRLTAYYMFFIVLVYPLLIAQLEIRQKNQLKNIVLILFFAFFIRLGLTVERYNMNKFNNALINFNFNLK